MKITDLINELETVMANFGDIEVWTILEDREVPAINVVVENGMEGEKIVMIE